MTRITIIILVLVEAFALFSMGDYAPTYNPARSMALIEATEYSDADYADMLNIAQSLEACLSTDSDDSDPTAQEDLLDQYITLSDRLSQARGQGLLPPAVERAYDHWLQSIGG